jgi:hypothetical protein
MARFAARCVLVLLVAATPLTVAASSTPSLEGFANGRELCPQVICGVAVFAGGFQGSVDGRPTPGIFVAAINHQDLLPVGETALVFGGQWTIQTFRGKFKGHVSDGLLENLNDVQFCVELTMEIDEGADGTVFFIGILDHGPFPPTIRGLVTQTPIGCSEI